MWIGKLSFFAAENRIRPQRRISSKMLIACPNQAGWRTESGEAIMQFRFAN
jgi:hypothetical protein